MILNYKVILLMKKNKKKIKNFKNNFVGGAKMAKYHNFGKFLVKKHSFGNK